MQVQQERGIRSVLSGLFRNVNLPTAKSVGKNLLEYGAQKAAGVLQGALDVKIFRPAIVDEFILSQGSTIRNRINQRAKTWSNQVASSHSSQTP